MKFWECIHVPGMNAVESDEGAQTSAPSLADATVLSVGNVEPAVKEAIEKAVEEAEPIQVVANVSQSYLDMRAAAFGRSTGTPKETVPETSETEYTSEEADAKQYVSVDDVDASTYETNSEFNADEVDVTDDAFDFSETTEPSNYITAEDLAIAEPGTVEQLAELAVDMSHTSLSKDALLDGILGTNSVSSDVDEVVAATPDKESKPQSTDTEYCRTDAEIEEIVATFNKYEEKYFKEIPAEHFSRRFLGNIPDYLYKAHGAAIVREEPDIMDPLFFLYITLVDDPYFAAGKFVDIITTEAVDNNEWAEAISKSVEEYDYSMAPEEEEEVEESSD